MKRNMKNPKNSKKTLYGDTIVEAIVAIAIYSIVAVLALGSMSSGLSTAQRNLESTMSRAAIDSQSEALRFYYESYLATKTGKHDDAYYGEIWENIKPEATTDPVSLDDSSLADYSCKSLIEADHNSINTPSHTGGKQTIFAISGRGAVSEWKSGKTIYGMGIATNPNNGSFNNHYDFINNQIISYSSIVAAPLYPRITYKNMNDAGKIINTDTATNFLSGEGGTVKDETGLTTETYYQSRNVYHSEGVWIYPKKTTMGYDYFVRTCWNPVGSKMPSVFTSVVRLYDAD